VEIFRELFWELFRSFFGYFISPNFSFKVRALDFTSGSELNKNKGLKRFFKLPYPVLYKFQNNPENSRYFHPKTIPTISPHGFSNFRLGIGKSTLWKIPTPHPN
jgi:hypothetical protein